MRLHQDVIVRVVAISIAAVALANAQDWPDRFDVKLDVRSGVVVCDRATGALELSAGYRALLRPGTTDDQLKTAFCDSIDRHFLLFTKKPYFFALIDKQREQDAEGTLHDTDIDKLRNTNGWLDLLNNKIFMEDTTEFHTEVEKVVGHSPFSEVAFPANDRFDLHRFQFHIRAPLPLGTAKLGGFAPSLPEPRMRKLLEPLDRLPTDPELIANTIATVYRNREEQPKLRIALDETPPAIEVYERIRASRVQIPVDVTECDEAIRLVYETAPSHLYSAFRKTCNAWIARALPTGAEKRELSFPDMWVEAGGKLGEERLPVFDEAEFQEQKGRLQTLKFELGTAWNDEERLLTDLVLAREVNAAAASQPASGKTNRAVATEAPLGIAPGKKNRIYGGVEYMPDQGVRPFIGYQRSNALGPGILDLEFGSQDELFSSGQYTRDLGLNFFGMLLTLIGEGKSDFKNQRILNGVLTDERRTGGGARADIEIARNAFGNRLTAGGAVRRETVRLKPAAEMSNDSERATNLTLLDLNFGHVWANTIGPRTASLHWNPALRIGLDVSGGDSKYARFTAEGGYNQELGGRTSVHFRLHAGKATESTPVFELLSLGGENSVRGFRSDDAIGRAYWSAQSEFWVRFLPDLGDHKILRALHRSLHFAPFFDIGQIEQATGQRSLAGVRRGVGAGLRVPFRGIVLALDWGYGAGDEAFRSGGGRVHFNFLLP